MQAVGQVIGGAIGGNIGAWAGGVVGGLIDSKLTKPKITNISSSKNNQVSNEGPRLTPNELIGSQYGTHINEHWGTVKASGQIIWATEIKETQIITKTDIVQTYSIPTQTGGGKRPKITNETITETTTTTTTNYTYHSNFALLIKKGKCKGISRIFINDELVLDFRLNKSSGSFMKKVNDYKYDGGCRINGDDFEFSLYTGYETQEQDELILQYESDYPSNNNYTYIVFKNFCLDKYSAQIPNFEFEIVNDDDLIFYDKVDKKSLLSNTEYNFNSINNNCKFSIYDECFYTFKSTNNNYILSKFDSELNNLIDELVLPKNIYNENNNGSLYYDPNFYFLSNGNIVFVGDYAISGTQRYHIVNTKDMTFETKFFNGADNFSFSGIFINNIKKNDIVVGLKTELNPEQTKKIRFLDLNSNSFEDKIYNENSLLNNYFYSFENNVYCTNYFKNYNSYSDIFYYAFYKQNELNICVGNIGNITIENENNTNYNVIDMFYNSEDDCIYVKYKKNTQLFSFFIAKINSSTLELEQKQEIILNTSNFSDKLNFNFNNQTFNTFYIDINNNLYVIKNELKDLTKKNIEKLSENYETVDLTQSNNYEIIYNYIDNFYLLLKDTQDKYINLDKIYLDRFNRNQSNVKSIIDHYLKRCNLIENIDFDTTELNDFYVRGYSINNSSNVENIINHLAYVFSFGVYESNGKIIFKKYDTAKNNIININSKDLACQQLTEDAEFENLLTIERIQDTELPKQFTIEYSDYDRNYQIGLQYSKYIDTQSEHIQSDVLPIVLTSEEAKNIVEKNIYLSYIQRDFFEFSLNYNYIDIEPLDIVKIILNQKEYILRINRTEMQNGIIKLSATLEQDDIDFSFLEGFKSKELDLKIKTISKSDFELLDIVALNNNHLDDFGFYYSAFQTSTNKNWNGSQLLESENSDLNNLTIKAATFENLQQGKLINFNDKFNTFNNDNNIDYASEIIVKMFYDATLYNCSFDDLLKYQNLIKIGNEILQFKNVELIDNNTYKLTNLLRSRFDTEYNNHIINEKVFLLNENTIKNVKETKIDEINIEKYYQSLSIGTYYIKENNIIKKFTNTAKRTQCFYVYNINYNKDALNNINISFNKKRRGIIDSFNSDFDPDFDNYKINIYSDNTFTNILNTYNLTETNFNYLENNNINDHGYFNNNLNIGIIKVNKFNQNGKELRQTINL